MLDGCDFMELPGTLCGAPGFVMHRASNGGLTPIAAKILIPFETLLSGYIQTGLNKVPGSAMRISQALIPSHQELACPPFASKPCFVHQMSMLDTPKRLYKVATIIAHTAPRERPELNKRYSGELFTLLFTYFRQLRVPIHSGHWGYILCK